MMSLRHFVLAAAAAAASVATIAPAVASERAQVSYQDLNLASEAGRAELSERIALAAWRVCRDPIRDGHMFASAVEACQRQTIASVSGQHGAVLAGTPLASSIQIRAAR